MRQRQATWVLDRVGVLVDNWWTERRRNRAKSGTEHGSSRGSIILSDRTETRDPKHDFGISLPTVRVLPSAISGRGAWSRSPTLGIVRSSPRLRLRWRWQPPSLSGSEPATPLAAPPCSESGAAADIDQAVWAALAAGAVSLLIAAVPARSLVACLLGIPRRQCRRARRLRGVRAAPRETKRPCLRSGSP
jgi:hypothetical protein